MSAHFNPYVQGWRLGNAPSGASAGGTPSQEVPSIFGALPGGNASRGQVTPPAPDATLFHITACRPNILNASVVDARGRSCYRIVTEPSQPLSTAYFDVHRRTVAVVDWSGERPSVEIPGLAPRQSIRSWLRAMPDRASRLMEVRGVPYIWVPEGEFICLYHAQSQSQSQRLARVYVSGDGVKVELAQQAMQAHLADVCILCASIFLSAAISINAHLGFFLKLQRCHSALLHHI
ncbi:hypothetical protein EI94DRAFT_1233372 [Lactarius quietus]|nr:hypothetical protein EI94DRAFT_1233372 [Lactarius quietus]